MRNIKIYTDSGDVLTLPQTRNVTAGGELVYKEITVVSGARKRYMQGFRPVITCEWDWFPAAQLTELIGFLRQGSFFQIEYPDQNGNDAVGWFSASYPQTKIFKFKDDKPMWHGVSITFTSRDLKGVDV